VRQNNFEIVQNYWRIIAPIQDLAPSVCRWIASTNKTSDDTTKSLRFLYKCVEHQAVDYYEQATSHDLCYHDRLPRESMDAVEVYQVGEKHQGDSRQYIRERSSLQSTDRKPNARHQEVRQPHKGKEHCSAINQTLRWPQQDLLICQMFDPQDKIGNQIGIDCKGDAQYQEKKTQGNQTREVSTTRARAETHLSFSSVALFRKSLIPLFWQCRPARTTESVVFTYLCATFWTSRHENQRPASVAAILIS